jgi:hypothetical protein
MRYSHRKPFPPCNICASPSNHHLFYHKFTHILIHVVGPLSKSELVELTDYACDVLESVLKNTPMPGNANCRKEYAPPVSEEEKTCIRNTLTPPVYGGQI